MKNFKSTFFAFFFLLCTSVAVAQMTSCSGPFPIMNVASCPITVTVKLRCGTAPTYPTTCNTMAGIVIAAGTTYNLPGLFFTCEALCTPCNLEITITHVNGLPIANVTIDANNPNATFSCGPACCPGGTNNMNWFPGIARIGV